MTPEGGLHFVVRNWTAKNLDTAFRVHIHPEHFNQVGFKLSDLCEITNEHGEPMGYGFAWRSTENMGSTPKVSPAKMTVFARDAFGIKEGSHVNLSKTDAKLVHAEKVTLIDVTPAEYVNGNEDKIEDGKWRWRIGSALCKLEAVSIIFRHH